VPVYERLVTRSRDYYDSRFAEFGATPAGVDWNSSESQSSRFEQLLAVASDLATFSVLDYGCGYGALRHWLVQKQIDCQYVGFDVSTTMIEHARRVFADGAEEFVSDIEALSPQDIAVASGIFNVKLDTPDAEWETYVFHLLAQLDRLSRLGFAFNMLTSYSDSEKMRADLYYGDPLVFFDHCKRSFSRNVALLHDYDLYEFTILVRKGAQ
jgi:SAM-dependent methyltransferase